jgi:hypothetical protein
METFGARPEEPTTACLSDVDVCEVFIGIYAHRYGFIPKGSEISITELEFDHARKKGKPILAFIVDPQHPWPEDWIEGEPGKSRLLTFRKKIEASLVRDLFNTPEDLAVRVAASVSRFLHESVGTAPGVKELTIVLELRKDAVVRMMEDAKQRALQSFRSGHVRDLYFISEDELVTRLNSMKTLFQDLHQQNVNALVQGQLLVSHELTAQIHTLLWVQERQTFGSIDVPVAYCRDEIEDEIEDEISRLYPQDPFGEIHGKENSDAGRFPASQRIAEIEAELRIRDPLNTIRPREREEVRLQRERDRIEQERTGLLEIDATRGVMEARLRSDGWTTCPFCNRHFSTVAKSSWDGERHRSCKTRLHLVRPTNTPDHAPEL